MDVQLSLGYIIRKVSAEDIPAWNICVPLGTLSTFFSPSFQLSTAKNEINLFNNNQVLNVAPVNFAPAGATTPSAEFLFYII